MLGDPTKLGGGTRPYRGSAATVTREEGGSLKYRAFIGDDGRAGERGGQASRIRRGGTSTTL